MGMDVLEFLTSNEPRARFDVERMAYLIACQESAAFFVERMPMAHNRVTREGVLGFCIDRAHVDGLTLEFGVAGGDSLRLIGERVDGPVHGFDTFEGLPEDWTHFQRAGRYDQSGAIPDNLPDNVQLVVGLFSDTLPGFLREHEGAIRLAHIDSDLYSSARCVLELIEPRLVPGSVIVFDEYFNYPGWKEHEHRAFEELTARSPLGFEYLAFASSGHSVGVIVTTRS